MIATTHTRRVAAPGPLVWSLMVDVDHWPRWQPAVSAATLHGEFAPGERFSWSTAGLDIVSTIQVVVPQRELAWNGPAGGIWGEHTWTFDADGAGVLVQTEETWAGAEVDADPVTAHRLLSTSLEQWMSDLDREARRRHARS